MIRTLKDLQDSLPAMVTATEKAPGIIELSSRFHSAGYSSLAEVLARAFEQASAGKGAERHANELPFHLQPMQQVAGQVGVGFLTGQAIKKTQESHSLPAGRDVAELLGAINYLAGAIIFLESQRPAGAVVANDNTLACKVQGFESRPVCSACNAVGRCMGCERAPELVRHD